MISAHGSPRGQILEIQIAVVKSTLGFTVKHLGAGPAGPLRSDALEKKRAPVKVIEPVELSDTFPLIPSMFGKYIFKGIST